jgi:hypothetical protein
VGVPGTPCNLMEGACVTTLQSSRPLCAPWRTIPVGVRVVAAAFCFAMFTLVAMAFTLGLTPACLGVVLRILDGSMTSVPCCTTSQCMSAACVGEQQASEAALLLSGPLTPNPMTFNARCVLLHVC